MTTFTRGENPLRADKLNTAFSERVNRVGDTMQGRLNLIGDPVAPLEAATKQYVDRFTSMGVPTGAYIGAAPPGNVLGPLWWDTNSGQLFIQYNDGSSTQWVSASSIDAAQLAGSFLPLTGGTVSGSVSIGSGQPNYMTLAGGAAGAPTTITTTGPWGDLDIVPTLNGRAHFNLWRSYPAASGWPELMRFDYAILGTPAGGTQPTAETHAINSDTVDTSSVAGNGMAYFNYTGGPTAGAVGGRTGFGMNFIQGGATTCPPGSYYVSGGFFAQASHSAGGSAGNPRGSIFGTNDSAWLKTGAGLYWEAINGCEIDVGAEAGTGVNYKIGCSVVLWNTDRVAGSGGADYAFGISAMDVCAGWDVGYAFGSNYGWWPMKSTGTLIGTIAPRAGGPAYTAAWGVDFSAVTFSGGLIRGPGFSVNSLGGIIQGTVNASTAQDLTHHIALRSGLAGFNYNSGTLGYVSDGAHNFFAGGGFVGQIGSTGINLFAIGQTTPAAGTFTHVKANNGMDFGTQTAAGVTDFSKHIALYGSTFGICVDNNANLQIVCQTGFVTQFTNGSSAVATISGTGINNTTVGATTPAAGTFIALTVNSTAGPTIRAGTGAATGTQPSGSLWLRTDGSAGARLYVSAGAGTWTAVATV